jgi:uncharacterized membrane protein
MNGKFLGLFLLTVIAGLAMVSASVSLNTGSLTFTTGINSTSFIVSNTNTTNLLNVIFSLPSISGESSYVVHFNNPSGTVNNINSSSPSTLTLTPTSAIDYTKFKLGKDYSAGSLVVSNSADPSDNQTIQLSVQKNYCKNGEISSGIEITSLKDEQMDNSNEWEWHPLDNIELTAKVSNSAGEDLDLILEYELVDSAGTSIDLNQDSMDLSVDDGKSKELTIDFKLPADVNSGSDYRLYIKAYEDGSEKTRCTSLISGDAYQDVNIKQETRSMVLSDINVPSSVSCNEAVDLTATLYNTGASQEKKTLVTLYNKELGINLVQLVDEKLNSGDDSKLTFNFNVPQNATQKTYTLQLKTYFKYDDSNSGCTTDESINCYDKSSDDLDNKVFTTNLVVDSGCTLPVVQTSQIQISAPESTNAGDEITIRLTITNTGNADVSYLPILSGADSFASIVTPFTPIIIPAGQNRVVSAVLRVNGDASGDYSYNIQEATNKFTSQSSIPLTVQASTNPFAGLFDNITSNWLIWVIVLVNVVLIVLIIVVAVRIARK